MRRKSTRAGRFKNKFKKRRLFWRVFLHGFLLIIVLALVSGIFVAILSPRTEANHIMHRFAEILSQKLDRNGDSRALQTQLDHFHHIMHSDVAVYTVNGQCLASSGENPPLPLPKAEAREIRGHQLHHRMRSGELAVAVPTGNDFPQAYLIIHWRHDRHHYELLAWLLLVAMVITLMSIPLVRSIVRPVERLTQTARRLREGDLTARTQLNRNDEMGILARTMDEMAERLGQRIRAEKELLANVSHEIRTPLARINVALELCEETGVSEIELQQYLSGIAQDTKELDRLIEDVLITTRLDLAETELDHTPFTVRSERVQLESVIATAQEKFNRFHPDYSLSLQLPTQLPSVEIDVLLFGRLLSNLLDNAAKYSPDNKQIELTVELGPKQLKLQVKDRGIGIDSDDQQRIFDPFYRTDTARSRQTGGTGLGLFVCRRIIESHGGSINAAGRDGGGTVFEVNVPLPS